MDSQPSSAIKPTDLRGILKYVPQFRDHTFVISIDGSIIEHENFSSLVEEIAVLRSLRINIVIVHGIGKQLKDLQKDSNTTLSDIYGSGPTDDTTLKAAITTSGEVTHTLIEKLSKAGLHYAQTNAVRATAMGILKGIDYQHTGKVDKIDDSILKLLMSQESIPLVSPISVNRHGQSFRINSDLLASKLASTLQASKLIFLTPQPGLLIHGQKKRNIPMEEVAKLLKDNKNAIDDRMHSKANYAVQALEHQVERAHILDGRLLNGLLIEIFDKVGIGTMIHANEYQQIRPAQQQDAQAIFELIQSAIQTESLRQHSLASISQHIGSYFVYQIDGDIIACAALLPMPGSASLELSSVYVQPFYENKGIGRKLVQFCCEHALEQNVNQVFALTTQTSDYFQDICGFTQTDLHQLPSARQDQYQQEGRQSKILVKTLNTQHI